VRDIRKVIKGAFFVSVLDSVNHPIFTEEIKKELDEIDFFCKIQGYRTNSTMDNFYSTTSQTLDVKKEGRLLCFFIGEKGFFAKLIFRLDHKKSELTVDVEGDDLFLNKGFFDDSFPQEKCGIIRLRTDSEILGYRATTNDDIQKLLCRFKGLL
jgi:hypothetical protein